jgi:nicotinate-nucleotide pyrophosphorylase (carboxylating)
MIDEILLNALKEDIGPGDYSGLACIPENALGKAKLLVKDNGVLAGVDVAKRVCQLIDPPLTFHGIMEDGTKVKKGDIAFEVTGSARSILAAERLMLNCMQRMSGIATLTKLYCDQIEGLSTKLLDTRKTTPGIRFLEKWAVRIGGGHNHRFALYDMVMLKDNHIDFAGGVEQAITNTKNFLAANNLDLKIEIEVRDFDELAEAMRVGGIDRIMLDNFTPENLEKALQIIDDKYETEASGGITLETLRSYAETGVDFISVGALTHSYKSLDMSLKSEFGINR